MKRGQQEFELSSHSWIVNCRKERKEKEFAFLYFFSCWFLSRLTLDWLLDSRLSSHFFYHPLIDKRRHPLLSSLVFLLLLIHPLFLMDSFIKRRKRDCVEYNLRVIQAFFLSWDEGSSWRNVCYTFYICLERQDKIKMTAKLDVFLMEREKESSPRFWSNGQLLTSHSLFSIHFTCFPSLPLLYFSWYSLSLSLSHFLSSLRIHLS